MDFKYVKSSIVLIAALLPAILWAGPFQYAKKEVSNKENKTIEIKKRHLQSFVHFQHADLGDSTNITQAVKDTLYPMAADSLAADYASAKKNYDTYMVELYNIYEGEKGPVKGKRVKGYTRNYFTGKDAGKVRLIKQRTDMKGYEYVDCLWYFDGKCLNSDSPAYEFAFYIKEGSHTIEAYDGDNLLVSFVAVVANPVEMVFTPHDSYRGEYGFDDNRYRQVAELNSVEYLDPKFKYPVPFMSIHKGQEAVLDAHIIYDREAMEGIGNGEAEVEFETSSPRISISGDHISKTGAGIYKSKLADFSGRRLRLTVKSDETTDEAYITARVNGKAAGRINIESREYLDPMELKLVKVVVNDSLGMGIDIAANAADLSVRLNNNSFNQAFVQWKVVVQEDLHLYIDKENISMRDIYTAADKHYKENNLNPERSAVMFVGESARRNDVSGYARVTNSDANRYSLVNSKWFYTNTPIHELGHNMGLKDLRNEFNNYFYLTNNFMDYYSSINNDNRRMFWRHQWRQIYGKANDHLSTKRNYAASTRKPDAGV